MKGLIKSAIMTGTVAMLTVSARASFSDNFNYAAGSLLPGYYHAAGSQNTGSSQSLSGSTLDLKSNTSGNSGITSGYVPTVQVAPAAGAAWQITTVFSTDWYGSNNLVVLDGNNKNTIFPAAGLRISDGTNSLSIQVKRDTSTNKDYIEIGYVGTGYTGSENNISSTWGVTPIVTSTSTTWYTLRVEKFADGRIEIGSSLAGMTTVTTLTTASTGVNLAAYNLLNGIEGNSIGLYVNGQKYRDSGKAVTASFDSLTLTGLDVVGAPVPEAASLGLLSVGAAGLMVRKRR